MAVLLVNVGWLLPCALIAALYPQAAFSVAAGALALLLLAAFGAGSGRRDSGS
jgi:hypothetical protein